VLPQEGYQGTDPTLLAGLLKERYGERFLDLPEDQAIAEIGPIVLEMVLEQVRTDLDLLGVRYDNWYSEQTLHQAGLVGQMIDSMRRHGRVAEREGAIWFASTEMGDDRDHVLVRSNGTPTYLAADIAYHYDKLMVRKFDRVVDIWGADHHGHVSGLMNAVEAFGADRARLTILLHQMVTLKRGNEIVRMSKRAGDYVALRDVIEEVGRDACRYFFLSRSANVQIDFDLDLAKEEKDDNPVYYLQYSHARIASILRRAEGLDPNQGDVSLLTDEAELALIRKMLQLPEVVEAAAAELEPHQLPFYARELASAFTQFYEKCRVLSSNPDDRPLTLARLKLVLAARTALANCLRLMGMSAPERMERADPA
jgi:arginyl-tRNA synthetase